MIIYFIESTIDRIVFNYTKEKTQVFPSQPRKVIHWSYKKENPVVSKKTPIATEENCILAWTPYLHYPDKSSNMDRSWYYLLKVSAHAFDSDRWLPTRGTCHQVYISFSDLQMVHEFELQLPALDVIILSDGLYRGQLGLLMTQSLFYVSS